MKTPKHIIIFGDFSVFSSYSKEDTLIRLRESTAFLSNYHGIFPISSFERILISVIEEKQEIVIVESSISQKDTVDILERVTDLLNTNETDFFCPDESF